MTLVRAVLDRRAPLADMGSVQKLFAMIVPMIREEPVGVGVGAWGGEGEGGEAKEGKAAGEAEGGDGDGGDGGDGEGGLAPATTLEEEQVGLWVCVCVLVCVMAARAGPRR